MTKPPKNQKVSKLEKFLAALCALAIAFVFFIIPVEGAAAEEKGKKGSGKKQPNILVIWGDDIGITNLSIYSKGLMGYRTPNIDRIADEGVSFTDYYGQQSCTA
ncbi:MAG: sulfatase-like hydrolase/transferase, partial [Bdellovibrionales bacterium]|nr:sulfatase-like hydrolase/transferase [Bdellovibrionales bacterium]